MKAEKRRAELIEWMRERSTHDGLTAHQIADVSGIYDRIGHYKDSRCFDDLVELQRRLVVRRLGRPARWWTR